MLDKAEVSPEILAAADRIVEWAQSGGGKRSPNIFKVEGYAGTGKTTLLGQVIRRIGETNVCCAALSGKAAFVMRQKGLKNATTIHSLIYTPEEPSQDRIKEVRKQLADTPNTLENRTKIRELKRELEELSQPRFTLNEESALTDADLLVLDEVSMVDAELAADLLSFGKPTLVVGDPGQLPPPKGDDQGFFNQFEADICLEKVHRQDADSGIVGYATDIRLGHRLGEYGTEVKLRNWSQLLNQEGEPWLYKQLLRANQVITGKHKTRCMLNRKMLKTAGHSGTYPSGQGEKLICVKNDHSLGIINGMPVALTDVSDPGPDKRFFKAKLLAADEQGEPTQQRGEVLVYKGHFDFAVDHDRDRLLFDHPDWQVRKTCVEIDWGYAITCHKAQGSEWPHVIVIDDGFGRRDPVHRRQWLYTAATRASKRLSVVRRSR